MDGIAVEDEGELKIYQDYGLSIPNDSPVGKIEDLSKASSDSGSTIFLYDGTKEKKSCFYVAEPEELDGEEFDEENYEIKMTAYGEKIPVGDMKKSDSGMKWTLRLYDPHEEIVQKLEGKDVEKYKDEIFIIGKWKNEK
tara:strand:- start:100 stop:516 length:417 start_codon:yes stop_codon:yes gene_type:complete